MTMFAAVPEVDAPDTFPDTIMVAFPPYEGLSVVNVTVVAEWDTRIGIPKPNEEAAKNDNKMIPIIKTDARLA